MTNGPPEEATPAAIQTGTTNIVTVVVARTCSFIGTDCPGAMTVTDTAAVQQSTSSSLEEWEVEVGLYALGTCRQWS